MIEHCKPKRTDMYRILQIPEVKYTFFSRIQEILPRKTICLATKQVSIDWKKPPKSSK